MQRLRLSNASILCLLVAPVVACSAISFSGVRELARSEVVLAPSVDDRWLILHTERAHVRCPYSDFEAFAAQPRALTVWDQQSAWGFSHLWSRAAPALAEQFVTDDSYELTEGEPWPVPDLLHAGLCSVRDKRSGASVAAITVVQLRRLTRNHEQRFRDFLLPSGDRFLRAR